MWPIPPHGYANTLYHGIRLSIFRLKRIKLELEDWPN